MHRAASLTGLLVTKPAAPAPQFVAEATVKPLPPRPAPKRGNDGLTRVSLRLNSARHLRLRLAAAHLGLSNHGMMVAAIDHYLDNVLPMLMAGRCACVEEGRAPVGNCAALGFGRAHPDRCP
ncbi:MAG TPA: hypothetical protein VGU20_24855 [Stellaceae bacterium]|nr:hypothetical protein [Stellaceae bacterium]